MKDSTAEAICGRTFEVCPSASRADQLGLTKELCGGIPVNSVFVASQQSSTGGLSCNPTGNDDVWGCARADASNPILTYMTNSTFLCEDTLVAVLTSSTVGFAGGEWWSNIVTDELNNIVCLNPDFGGVLCCWDGTSIEPVTLPPPHILFFLLFPALRTIHSCVFLN